MKRFGFVSDALIDQVEAGRKTATADRLENLGRDLDAYNHAVVLGERYRVFDSARRPRCTIRVTGTELCRWDRIPERLWRGEGNVDAEEFRRDHEAFFDRPEPDFEFAAIYFVLEPDEAR